MTSDERTRLLNYSVNTPYELLIAIYVWSGLRRSEALALCWSDISNGYISVTKQINKKKEVAEPKTKKAKRLVPILPQLQKIIDKYRMPNSIGKIFDWVPDYITHELKTIFVKLNMTDIDIHCLRHTYATMLKDLDIPGDVRTAWLGHSKLDHKDRYEHIDNYYLQQNIRLLLERAEERLE